MEKQLKDAYESVRAGWWPLLDKYLPQLFAIDPDCDLIVKEKYGLLRIRPYKTSEGVSRSALRAIYLEAENVSASVCEICGAPGKLRTDQEWWETLCDECAVRSALRHHAHDQV